MESLLSWFQETKMEIIDAKERLGNLQTQILNLAMEKKIFGIVNFDYAGDYFQASLNVDRTRTKLPKKDEVIEQFRKMLPEDKQTTENAKKIYTSLCDEDSPMNDSVTIKPVAPPQEVIDEMAEAMQKELNKEA
jgi:hypothetical protein